MGFFLTVMYVFLSCNIISILLMYASVFIATVTLTLSARINMILILFLQILLVEFLKDINVLSVLFSLTFLLINLWEKGIIVLRIFASSVSLYNNNGCDSQYP